VAFVIEFLQILDSNSVLLEETLMAKTKPSLRETEIKPVRDNSPSAVIPEEHIAQRAYALYEARGREDGHDLADWLQAERELLEERSGTE
jgi:hypothetical protein